MTARRYNPTASIVLIGASVAIVASMGVAADGSAAALACEPRQGGAAVALAGRERVGEWLGRLTDAAREWRRHDRQQGAGHPAIDFRLNTPLPALNPQAANIRAIETDFAQPSVLRPTLIDLPPPATPLLG